MLSFHSGYNEYLAAYVSNVFVFWKIVYLTNVYDFMSSALVVVWGEINRETGAHYLKFKKINDC